MEDRGSKEHRVVQCTTKLLLPSSIFYPQKLRGLPMAETTTWECDMRHWRRALKPCCMAGHAACGRHRKVVIGQALDIFREHGGDAEPPGEQQDDRQHDIHRAHKRAAHRRAVVAPRSLFIK